MLIFIFWSFKKIRFCFFSSRREAPVSFGNNSVLGGADLKSSVELAKADAGENVRKKNPRNNKFFIETCELTF
jgi:hypothetical protein